jgi:hypothetical protein
MGFVGLLQALVLSSLGALNSFFLAQKESKQRKSAPCITVNGKKRHRSPCALHK